MSKSGPVNWPQTWDARGCRLFMAFDGETLLGGAAVNVATPAAGFLHGHEGVAALWDIRVAPEYRGLGIGARLLSRAAAHAQRSRCRQLAIETQNTNVAACRFYASQGCTLGMIDRYAYPGSDEVMLVWFLDLNKAEQDVR